MFDDSSSRHVLLPLIHDRVQIFEHTVPVIEEYVDGCGKMTRSYPDIHASAMLIHSTNGPSQDLEHLGQANLRVLSRDGRHFDMAEAVSGCQFVLWVVASGVQRTHRRLRQPARKRHSTALISRHSGVASTHQPASHFATVACRDGHSPGPRPQALGDALGRLMRFPPGFVANGWK